MFFTTAEKVELKYIVARFCAHYCWLAKDAMNRGVCMWSVVPKFHYFCHVAEQCCLINSHFVQNYKEESFVGRICQVYKSLKNGPFWGPCQHKCLQKYLVALQVLLGVFEAN